MREADGVIYSCRYLPNDGEGQFSIIGDQQLVLVTEEALIVLLRELRLLLHWPCNGGSPNHRINP